MIAAIFGLIFGLGGAILMATGALVLGWLVFMVGLAMIFSNY